MPNGLCDACKAAALKPVIVRAKEVKVAVNNGFRPRYGLANFEAGFMAALGANFGMPNLKPPKELQDSQHAKATTDFLSLLKTKDDHSEVELCTVCAAEVSKRAIRSAEDSQPIAHNSIVCALCGNLVADLPDETAYDTKLPDWLRKMSGKGFRCYSCKQVICTSCMLSYSSNQLGPASTLAVNFFRGKDELESGIDPDTVCALCIQLVVYEATCPKCHRQSVGYSGKEIRERRRQEEMKLKIEEDRVKEIRFERQAGGRCVNCGKALGFIDWLMKHERHSACTVFHD